LFSPPRIIVCMGNVFEGTKRFLRYLCKTIIPFASYPSHLWA